MQIEAAREKLKLLPTSEPTVEITHKGYLTAISKAKDWAINGTTISDKMIPTLHALMMGDGQSKIKLSAYRELSIPDACISQEIPGLMKSLADWINANTNLTPCPIIAAIAYIQCIKIHPYDEGSQNLAILLSSLILEVQGYKLPNLNPSDFFFKSEITSLSQDSNITPLVETFVKDLATAFENLLPKSAPEAKDKKDLMRSLNLRQRKALRLFKNFTTISASQLGEQFNLKPRTRAKLCKDWVDAGFLEVVDASNKARKYKLKVEYESLIP